MSDFLRATERLNQQNFGKFEKSNPQNNFSPFKFPQFVRNRFFHYMNGSAKNIETSNISDVDILFSLVNKKFLYWLSTVFLAVFSHAALDFESIRTRIA